MPRCYISGKCVRYNTINHLNWTVVWPAGILISIIVSPIFYSAKVWLQTKTDIILRCLDLWLFCWVFLILLTQISLPNQLSSFSISASQLEINGQRSNDSSNFNGLKKGRCLKMENFIWSLFWNCLIRIACSHVDHLIEFSELIHIRGLNK